MGRQSQREVDSKDPLNFGRKPGSNRHVERASLDDHFGCLTDAGSDGQVQLPGRRTKTGGNRPWRKAFASGAISARFR